MGKAANEWLRWNVDSAGGNIDAGFPSPFQIHSPDWNNLWGISVAIEVVHLQYSTH